MLITSKNGSKSCSMLRAPANWTSGIGSLDGKVLHQKRSNSGTDVMTSLQAQAFAKCTRSDQIFRGFHQRSSCRSKMSIRVSKEAQARFQEVLMLMSSFVHAPHSRAKLRVTRKMLLSTLTYHQVMPSFLDFLFSYGEQHHAQDFHFTGFRHETRLSEAQRELSIPDLGRSGRNVQLCYNLRSVEYSPDPEAEGDPEYWPWSIRGTATHHAFDFETGQSNWIIVKGNELMKKRIIEETSSGTGLAPKDYESLAGAFSSTLFTHLMLCNWACENWRWYINFLEQAVQKITRKTLSLTVSKAPPAPMPAPQYTRTSTGHLVNKAHPQSAKTVTIEKQSVVASPQGIPQGPPSGPPPPPPVVSANPIDSDLSQGSEFSFEDLQRIEHIEEQANETLLVITLNNKVMTALGEHYHSIMGSKDCPVVLQTGCDVDFARFMNRLASISDELQIQKARVETLLRLLADRKALV
jgi:hypothetical protein